VFDSQRQAKAYRTKHIGQSAILNEHASFSVSAESLR
jgi:hypothetical protein